MNMHDQMLLLRGENKVTRILDEHEGTQSRTNASNDGRSFQSEIDVTNAAYQRAGIASLSKTDPPVRVLGGGSHRKVIFMKNPFLDYAGAWTARNGRALFIEAKSTKDHRLAFGDSNGFHAEQLATMVRWRKAKAATALLWQHNGAVTIWTPEMLLARQAQAAKSLIFEEGVPVRQGSGMIIWDYIAELERLIWPPKPPP